NLNPGERWPSRLVATAAVTGAVGVFPFSTAPCTLSDKAATRRISRAGGGHMSFMRSSSAPTASWRRPYVSLHTATPIFFAAARTYRFPLDFLSQAGERGPAGDPGAGDI